MTGTNQVLVCGGAGFVGVNLVRVLLSRGTRVCVADNFSRGSRANLREFEADPRFSVCEVDLADPSQVSDLVGQLSKSRPLDEVWHLAANSDIPAGIADPNIDLKDTFLTTVSLVNALRSVGTRKVYFASSSAIYGDLGDIELREHTGPLLPISNYGAMKLASEAFLSAAAESHLEQVMIFRFPNVVGVPATHGVLLDFARKLRKDRSHLEVLGNGTQRKGYLHVSDLVTAMLHLHDTVTEKRAVFNIGAVDAGVSVRQIAEGMVALVAPDARLEFGNSNRGWVGDVPKFHYSVDKLLATGWRPVLDSQSAMTRAMHEVARQEGLL